MRYKSGVVFDKVAPSIWYAIGVTEAVYERHGFSLVVTSLLDGMHGEKSLHYLGRAFDARTRTIPSSTLEAIVRDMNEILFKQGYDVVVEKDHIHCEYDPKAPRPTWQQETI